MQRSDLSAEREAGGREGAAAPPPGVHRGAGGRERAAAPLDGPLLVLGAAGTGKSELLARRLADLATAGTPPDRVLVLGARRATTRRLRDRCEALLDGPYEGLWGGCWDQLGGRVPARR